MNVNSSFDESVSSEAFLCSPNTTCEEEYVPTPWIMKHSLASVNNVIKTVNGRDVSPVRAQLHSQIDDVSQSTLRYYKRKSLQSCMATLECIAPGQSKAMFELICKHDKDEHESPQDELIQKLITLYQDATSRSTRLEILSIFVQDYSKSQLKAMISGITTWRIDEARKHAVLYGPGKAKEVPETHRTRMDPMKVDHFLDFISSPHFLQDVAYGTKILKLSNGKTMEIPNVVRTVTSSRLVGLYQKACKENEFETLGRSTLFSILKVC